MIGMQKHVRSALAESSAALANLAADEIALAAIERAGAALVTTFQGQGRVYSCGNGGSMSDAIHFAEELSGKFRKERRALPAAAVSDPGHLTCVANDYGYDKVFSRYVEAHGRKGDALLAISTSGRSPNVLAAAASAGAIGMTVIALTGKTSSPVGRAADIEICTPCGEWSDRIQELHIKVIHILVELVERRLFPENYPG
jgi:D-sedoheptulose 7-phosphate isomerase